MRDIDRQELAFGKPGHDLLRSRSVGVVGISGGGSHVCQQLIYAGVGRIVPVDDETIEETNLRRVVGATAADVASKTLKVDIAARVASAVRPWILVEPVRARFPGRTSIESLSGVDVIIGCLDNDASKNDLNNFALQYRIPYVDIGATIIPQESAHGFRTYGQVACVWPGGPCLRCMGIISEESITEGREHQTGYLGHSPGPQVVSINGTLASEAVTATLLYLTIRDRQPSYRRYVLPPGTLTAAKMTIEPACAYCGFSGRTEVEKTA